MSNIGGFCVAEGADEAGFLEWLGGDAEADEIDFEKPQPLHHVRWDADTEHWVQADAGARTKCVKNRIVITPDLDGTSSVQIYAALTAEGARRIRVAFDRARNGDRADPFRLRLPFLTGGCGR